jgi:hypothetical protein
VNLTNPFVRLVAIGLAPPLCVLLIAIGVFGVPIQLWVTKSDFYSFLAVSREIATGQRTTEPQFVERVFLGWPLVLTPVATSAGAVAFAVGLSVSLAALLPALVWVYTRDLRTAVLSATASPTWVLTSTLGMSEPIYLAAIMASLILHSRRRPFAAAALMGFAGLVRPTAVFAWAGVIADLIHRRAGKREWVAWILVCGGIAALTVPIDLAIYGVPLRQFEEYSRLPNIDAEARTALKDEVGGHLGIPFRALLMTPFQVNVPVWKVAFIWTQAVLVVAATAMAGAFCLRGHGPDRVLAVWAMLNTAFIVSAGPYWGFYTFDRYLLWALPAYLFVSRRIIPDRPLLLALTSIPTIALALAARWHMLAAI